MYDIIGTIVFFYLGGNMRADGKRVKNADPESIISAHIMSRRTDAMNMITVDIPIEPIKEYIAAKREYKITHLALIISAYLRTVEEFPYLNRFVVNKKLYDRNEFCVGMVVLKSGDTSNGTMSKMYFDYEDTIFDVQRKIDGFIEENRKEGNTNTTDEFASKLVKIPGLCLVGVKLFKFLDRYGMLPKKIIDISPFHMSLGITNLASIRTNHIHHHTYEFGTTSVFMSLGNMRYIPKMSDGKMIFERCIPLGVVMDERICTGAYYAMAFRRISEYLKKPELLELPSSKTPKKDT